MSTFAQTLYTCLAFRANLKSRTARLLYIILLARDSEVLRQIEKGRKELAGDHSMYFESERSQELGRGGSWARYFNIDHPSND